MAGLPAKKNSIEVLAGRWIEFTSTVKYCTVYNTQLFTLCTLYRQK